MASIEGAAAECEQLEVGHQPRERADWPDPVPRVGELPMVDDVTRMNFDHVERLFCVRSKEDVKHVLGLARQNGKKVSMRGTRHTMGGQTIAPGGYVIDLLKLRQFSFDRQTELITTGALP